MSAEGMSAAAPLIAARDLVLDFHVKSAFGAAHGLRALDDVSLDVRPGEIVGLVGESGSGKTTLGKAILGAHRPGAGRILYRGTDIAALDGAGRRPFRREMQMVFQDPLSSFNPRFTIASSLALPLRLHRICPEDAIPATVAALLQRVGLRPEHAARYPHELSGGQLQRIAIARAISVTPSLIVADEAVSKLDVSVRAQVLNLLNRMNRETGVSLIFITHDLGVARFLCHRIAVMYFGRIVEIGPTAEIFANPRHPYTRSLLDARHGGSGHVATDADETALSIVDPARACNYAARCARRAPECLTARPRLDFDAAGHAAACFAPLPPASGESVT
ncbi:MAG: ABC transporter ATP-binding protein [Methylobacteriaceae bacterium]|nr:ABC transporter ATP-binding protein [Methylobacteriaceae bacterium]